MREINLYLEWKGTYAPRASQVYRIHLERFVKSAGEKRLEDYTLTDWITYRNKLADHFSTGTIQVATIAVKNFFKFWKTQKRKCLDSDLIKITRATPTSHRAIEADEFDKLLSVIPTNCFFGLRDAAIIAMLWDTGVRVSELTNLDTSQITDKRRCSIATRKTTHKRIISWSKETHKIVMRYVLMRIHLTNSPALFIGLNKHGQARDRLTTRTIERIIKTYTKIAGLTKITPHSFRHGWAHYRRDKFNAQLSFIQKGLGHMNPVSTFVYEQYSDKNFEMEAEKYFT